MDLYMYYLYNNNIKFDSNADHTRLEFKARDDIDSNGSDRESEDYDDNDPMIAHQQGLNDENNQTNSPSPESSSFSLNRGTEDIFTKQRKLKEEARVALALGAKMARMQVEIERQILQKKRSSFYDIIGIDITPDTRFNIDMLSEMNIGQLQTLVNDLHCRIEANNDELVNLLIERDSLCMEQDSILVDIEDFTKRLQEHGVYLSKRTSPRDSSDSPYAVKNLEQHPPKKSIFHFLFRKALFV